MTTEAKARRAPIDAVASALRDFETIVGAEWVRVAERDLVAYSDDYAIAPGADHAVGGAVAPKSAEEVQAILRVAQARGAPLWPISRGKNLGYGGAAPLLPGSIILDLSRMNRILEINEKLGYAVVEPGVSFFDLYQRLQQEGIKLWLSSPGHGLGSVIGNALERGFGFTPYGDHTSKLCGLEVVLPNGDVVRTGMGAMAIEPRRARLPLRLRPALGPAVRPIQFRRRDAGGRVADARAGSDPQRAHQPAGIRRHRLVYRRDGRAQAARALSAAADLRQLFAPCHCLLAPQRMVGRFRPDPRSHRAKNDAAIRNGMVDGRSEAIRLCSGHPCAVANPSPRLGAAAEACAHVPPVAARRSDRTLARGHPEPIVAANRKLAGRARRDDWLLARHAASGQARPRLRTAHARPPRRIRHRLLRLFRHRAAAHQQCQSHYLRS